MSGADMRAEESAAGDEEHGGRDGRLTAARTSLRELVLLTAIALVLALLLKAFLVQAFYIPSGSMLDTLQLDDRVLVEKVSYHFREPVRGETVVFHRPGAVREPGLEGLARSVLSGLGLPGGDMDLIKRVIGLPGETVEIVAGVVLIDGQPLDEPYARTDGRDHPAVTVPDGHLFLLGDNRGNSDDSRYSLGMVPASAVVGRTMAIVWPLDHATTQVAHRYPASREAAVTAPAGVGSSRP